MLALPQIKKGMDLVVEEAGEQPEKKVKNTHYIEQANEEGGGRRRPTPA